MNELSLAHCKYESKYHIVFAPKYRRQVIYGEIKNEVGKILRRLCEYERSEHRGGGGMSHIHMLVEIPPKYAVSDFMGYLKGKSSLMIFDRFANLKYKYGNRHFWCKGYYVSTIGRNEKKIREYIQKQLEEDRHTEQISMKEYYDPFKKDDE